MELAIDRIETKHQSTSAMPAAAGTRITSFRPPMIAVRIRMPKMMSLGAGSDRTTARKKNAATVVPAGAP